jgi:hypothetical protein
VYYFVTAFKTNKMRAFSTEITAKKLAVFRVTMEVVCGSLAMLGFTE